VTGLNIEDPEAARKIIKPWDERHDMQVFCESGVDDQVCCISIALPFDSAVIQLRFLFKR
jgi:hypothetical protein